MTYSYLISYGQAEEVSSCPLAGVKNDY